MYEKCALINTTIYKIHTLISNLHSIKISIILDTLQELMVIKGYYFNFNIYTYYLYKCSGVDNIYIIQQNLKKYKSIL